MKIYLMITFRYRIKPSRAQVGTLCRHLETCRHLYNRLLEELNRAHEAGETISWQSAVGLVPKWKKSTFPELQGVYSRVAAMVAKQL
ncbi:MAG TPA: helix-turn-helix domain-containing protein, partial [Candidatus Lokiarchaeia archaeon]|nr:helix-turn-helix domain-containing protein [Candidatus Lokiarchaeia archaeon]